MIDWITAHKIPLGAWLKDFVTFLNNHAQGFFDFVRLVLGSIISTLLAVMLWFPPLVLVAIFAAGTYLLHRSVALAVSVVVGLLLVINLGYWQATVETLALVLCATLLCVVIGIPVGVAAAHRPWLYTALLLRWLAPTASASRWSALSTRSMSAWASKPVWPSLSWRSCSTACASVRSAPPGAGDGCGHAAGVDDLFGGDRPVSHQDGGSPSLGFPV